MKSVVSQAPCHLERSSPSRRAFLRRAGVGLGSVAALGSGLAFADVPSPDRRLRVLNDHTGEWLDIVYHAKGRYLDEALVEINHLMRDHRAEQERVMDPYLLDDLARLHGGLGTDEPLHLLSGYRTPETNARLRKRSSGVAKYSLHMEGRAADIYVPGVPTKTLHERAVAMQSGGVGYYGRSGFVHVDTGRIRRWGTLA